MNVRKIPYREGTVPIRSFHEEIRNLEDLHEKIRRHWQRIIRLPTYMTGLHHFYFNRFDSKFYDSDLKNDSSLIDTTFDITTDYIPEGVYFDSTKKFEMKEPVSYLDFPSLLTRIICLKVKSTTISMEKISNLLKEIFQQKDIGCVSMESAINDSFGKKYSYDIFLLNECPFVPFSSEYYNMICLMYTFIQSEIVRKFPEEKIHFENDSVLYFRNENDLFLTYDPRFSIRIIGKNYIEIPFTTYEKLNKLKKISSNLDYYSMQSLLMEDFESKKYEYTPEIKLFRGNSIFLNREKMIDSIFSNERLIKNELSIDRIDKK
jgi:hypothetical protein